MADGRFNGLFFAQCLLETAESFDGLDETIHIGQVPTRDFNSNLAEYDTTTLNQLYDRTNPYEIGSYAGYSPSTRIGFAGLFGKRDNDEDRLAFGKLANFHLLTHEHRILALKNTVHSLSTLMQNHQMNFVGSTLCFTVQTGRSIYTVNVGDSMAFLSLVNNNGQSTFMRLNNCLHNPLDPIETERLQRENKFQFVIKNRLQNLALSRSMGNIDLEKIGLSHEPDVYHHAIETTDATGMLIVACDGLTERDCIAMTKQHGEYLNIISLQELCETYHNNDPETIAIHLANHAYDMNSHDNILVAVTKLNLASESATYAAVFDGHGGIACADLLRRSLHFVLLEEISAVLSVQNKYLNHRF